MTSVQKVIKYVAIAFAVFLIVTIFSSLAIFLQGFSYVLGLTKDVEISEKLEEVWTTPTTPTISEITNLDIDIKISNLTIKESDTFHIETNSKYITCKEKNNKIVIRETTHNLNFNFNKNELQLVVYLPKDVTLNKTSITTGVGKVKIENLNTLELDLELGAGKVTIDNITSKKSDIETGAGKLTINNGSLGKLDFEMGVGSATITTSLEADSKIESGVGSLDITLLGSTSDYCIRAEKGIGTITIDDRNISSEEIVGRGDILLNVEGGVGSIKINFNESENHF